MKKNARGVIGTRRCNCKDEAGAKCQDTVEIKNNPSTVTGPSLLCVAQCTSCKSWFDCRKPIGA